MEKTRNELGMDKLFGALAILAATACTAGTWGQGGYGYGAGAGASTAAGGYTGGSYAQTAAPSGPRNIRFNQQQLNPQQLQVVANLEAQYQVRLPDGDYWYDHRSGAAGFWGGPVAGFLPAGLDLPGPLPANASGGGTGIFFNGRELHPADAQGLAQLLGQPVPPGRYWIDAQGNAGAEGGPAVVNLVAVARQRGNAGGNGNGNGNYIRSVDNGNGSNSYIGGDGNTSYFFDGGTGCSVIPGEGVSC